MIGVRKRKPKRVGTGLSGFTSENASGIEVFINIELNNDSSSKQRRRASHRFERLMT